jgi:hypothetical protein
MAENLNDDPDLVIEHVKNKEENKVPNKMLNPITHKIIERAIKQVLGDYVKDQKVFTVESLHYLRTRVTDLVKERLGDDEILSVDIGLNLTDFSDIPFFFKVNVPKEKLEDHILSVENETEEEVNDTERIKQELSNPEE